jgi:hypothetical protein
MPLPTGSIATVTTIGIVLLARCTGATNVPAATTTTSTFGTSSAARRAAEKRDDLAPSKANTHLALPCEGNPIEAE